MAIVEWVVFIALIGTTLVGTVLGGYAIATGHRKAAKGAVALSAVLTGLGVLGTVCGLIVAFDAVSTAAPETKAALLSAGISLAMRSTAIGIVGALVVGTLGAVGWIRGPVEAPPAPDLRS